MELACSRSPDVRAWRWPERESRRYHQCVDTGAICGKAAVADARGYQPAFLRQSKQGGFAYRSTQIADACFSYFCRQAGKEGFFQTRRLQAWRSHPLRGL